jgi:hypothetical protein
MQHQVKHGLDFDTAKRATDKAFQTYTEKFSDYNPEYNWNDDRNAEVSFSAKGVSVSGDVEIKENSIEFDLDVPFLLKAFKGKAVSVIEDEIQKWVDRAERGELDDY